MRPSESSCNQLQAKNKTIADTSRETRTSQFIAGDMTRDSLEVDRLVSGNDRWAMSNVPPAHRHVSTLPYRQTGWAT